VEPAVVFSHSIQTSEGELLIQGPVSADVLSVLQMDSGLKAFRPPTRQLEALTGISQMENSRVVIAQREGILLGYVTFHPPESFERWAHGPQHVLELGAIEVSPVIRRYGVARHLLEVAFSDLTMENYLVVATEYYWHWDLEGSGLHIWEYRDIMRRLMAHVGMVVKDTDEEEIASHPANMLTVRYGRDVPHEAVIAFEELLFKKPDSNRG